MQEGYLKVAVFVKEGFKKGFELAIPGMSELELKVAPGVKEAYAVMVNKGKKSFPLTACYEGLGKLINRKRRST
ncbi:hypothetical protein JXB11_03345 [Candidatus Woesearchaeota archaeon]|nr:hypothetical protein [Candidatus Woesearchaeota archaeon]